MQDLSTGEAVVQEVMRREQLAASKPMLLFCQPGIASFLRAAKEVAHLTPALFSSPHFLTVSPTKAATLLQAPLRTLRTKIHHAVHPTGPQSAPGLPSSPHSAPLSRVSSPQHAARSSARAMFPHATTDSVPAAPPRRARRLRSSASSGTLRRQSMSSPTQPDASPRAASPPPQRASPSAEEALDVPQAEQELFQVIVRLGKVLYPGKRTWLATASHVAVWLGLSNSACVGLHGFLRRRLASDAALAALLRGLKVRPSSSRATLLTLLTLQRRRCCS